ncbi:MAG: hypothetical protein WAX38_00990 [Minisyncoccia bacterium]
MKFTSLFSHKYYLIASFALVCFLYVVAGMYLYVTQSLDTDAAKRIEPIVITNADVYGNNLPPQPTAEEISASIEGPDKNANYIRDDVELAIYAEYPHDLKLRAASLQYAQALQLLLTKVGGEETMRIVLMKDSAGWGCISDQLPSLTEEQKLLDDGPELTKIILAYDKIRDEKALFVENLVMNAVERKERKKEIYKKYMTSFSSGKNDCVLNLGL